MSSAHWLLLNCTPLRQPGFANFCLGLGSVFTPGGLLSALGCWMFQFWHKQTNSHIWTISAQDRVQPVHAFRLHKREVFLQYCICKPNYSLKMKQVRNISFILSRDNKNWALHILLLCKWMAGKYFLQFRTHIDQNPDKSRVFPPVHNSSTDEDKGLGRSIPCLIEVNMCEQLMHFSLVDINQCD